MSVVIVAGIFFPIRETLGLDARALSPGMVERVTFSAAETRSFARAELALEKIGGVAVSANTVQRVVGDIGAELAARRDADPKGGEVLARRPEEPPELAVVECDGGRARTREPGHGRGVHLCGEGWRETKNACLVRASRKMFAADPQPQPPASSADFVLPPDFSTPKPPRTTRRIVSPVSGCLVSGASFMPCLISK